MAWRTGTFRTHDFHEFVMLLTMEGSVGDCQYVQICCFSGSTKRPAHR